MARKIGGNLPTHRVLFRHHHVGITRTALHGDTVLHDYLLGKQLDADCVAFCRHVDVLCPTNDSVAGNTLAVAVDVR